MLQGRSWRTISSVSRSSIRLYTTEPPKASVQLVAKLRKATDTSISKAREALIATNNDYEAALEWLEKDLAVTGAKKAAKVEGREANEGLIGLSILSPGLGKRNGSVRASIVELNCETDFVARNELFDKLLADIAFSVAFHAEQPMDFQDTPTLIRSCPVDALLDAPYLEIPSEQTNSEAVSSIGSAIRDSIAKLGEKIQLRRAASVVFRGVKDDEGSVQAGLRVGSYAHGGKTPTHGRIGTLALLYLKSPELKTLIHSSSFLSELEKLDRAVARQIAGLDTRSIHFRKDSPETSLYEQPFMMFPGEYSSMIVREALQKWASQNGMLKDSDPNVFEGVSISEFARWTVGEELDVDRPQIVSGKCVYH